MYNKQILVTGGTGFVGSYLLRYLVLEGYERIRATRRASSTMDLVADVADRIEWVECDLQDLGLVEDVLRDVDWVFHCAAVVSFRKQDQAFMRQVNIEGTAHLVNHALLQGVERFLHVSSVAAIGRRKNLSSIDEETGWERSGFNSQYAVSKHLSEMEVWRGIGEGLNAVIVNPSVILGSGDWRGGTAKMFATVWKGLAFYPVGSSGFVDVRDVARYMVRLMESPIQGERYILNGENLSYKELFGQLAAVLEKPSPRFRVPRLLAGLSWRVEGIRSFLLRKEPVITRETANNSMQRWVYDNRKSLEALDFSYTPISKTLAQTGKQFLEASRNGLEPKQLPLL